MKKILFAVGMSLLAACGTATTQSAVKDSSQAPAATSLAGKTYSRTFVVEPMFGQPGGERTHYLKFSVDGTSVEDNANTFFGNHPAGYSYELAANLLKVKEENNHVAVYTLSADSKTLTSEAGAVLTLESQETTADLDQSEIAAAIALFDRVGVPLVGNSVCTSQTATIKSRVKGFNPATWTVIVDGQEKDMLDSEKSAAVALFNRLNVPAIQINSITLESKATIKSAVCGFNPANWTVTL